jgi:hypothetical protein
MQVSQDHLKALFTYSDGELIYINTKGRGVAGRAAGSRNEYGYVRTSVIGFKYLLVHRLIWILHYGAIPDDLFIDHINGQRDDNRISNLRLVNRSQNKRNSGIYATNTVGVRGVTMDKGKFRTRLSSNGKTYELGSYDTKAEAKAAYEAVAKVLDGEYYRKAK